MNSVLEQAVAEDGAVRSNCHGEGTPPSPRDPAKPAAHDRLALH